LIVEGVLERKLFLKALKESKDLRTEGCEISWEVLRLSSLA
jgi:hypothetical protein